MTITLTSALPAITQDNLTIDASNAGVILDGSMVGGLRTPGLDLRASGVAVRGLQIARFPGCGIELRGQHNTIGGDRQVGIGPLGQGNLISGNGICGIGMWDVTTAHNTIQGNLIGVDITGLQAWGNVYDGIHINSTHHNTIQDNVISGNSMAIQACCNTDSSYNVIRDNLMGVGIDGQQPIPNTVFGVLFGDGASYNTLGPGNIIAHNPFGVQVDAVASVGNTVTRNNIHSNVEGGIRLMDGGNANLAAPTLMSFNLAAGAVWGRACGGCRVEVFSDLGDQGSIYEGYATADLSGFFAFDKGSPLSGPHLTATATDGTGNTSPFSKATTGSGAEWVIQTGNYAFMWPLEHKRSTELAENRIGGSSAPPWQFGGSLADYLELELFEPGFKHTHISLNEVEEPIDWSRSEFYFGERDDEWFTLLVENGVSIAYVLSFWDKANHPNGWPEIPSRFTTEEEILRYLEYVRFVVNHLKDRVETYDLWNEPDNTGTRFQYIEPADYVELVRRTVPVIREVYPEAKIMVGSTTYLRDSLPYLEQIIASDIMPLVDVVAWHPMFDTSPEHPDHRNYYYAYPQIVRQLQATAFAHGFRGTFRADEILWCSPDVGWCDFLYTNVTAAKYLGRGVITNLGLDVQVSSCTSHTRKESFEMLRNLATQFAGAQAVQFPVQVQTTITNVAKYTFALPNDSFLVALWNDGIAVDEDPGVNASVELPGFGGYVATGLDPLHSIQQSLITHEDGDTLIIENLLLKDYPLLIQLTPPRQIYLPLVMGK